MIEIRAARAALRRERRWLRYDEHRDCLCHWDRHLMQARRRYTVLQGWKLNGARRAAYRARQRRR